MRARRSRVAPAGASVDAEQAQVLERAARQHHGARLARLPRTPSAAASATPSWNARRDLAAGRPAARSSWAAAAARRRGSARRRRGSAYGSAATSPASCSSSIAAWPSYVTRSRTPSSAATASNSRPMPDESGAFTGRGSGAPPPAANGTGAAGRLEVGGRDAPRLADRRPRRRAAAPVEVGDALERREIAAQQLAAPQRSVGAVPGAVEHQRQRRAGEAVLGQARGGVGVVVLHADQLGVLALAPSGREVVGVQVVRDHVGADVEHREVEREIGAERARRPARCRGRRGGATGTRGRRADAERALQLGADGEHRRGAATGSGTASGA